MARCSLFLSVARTAYTIFNVYFPKLLELSSSGDGAPRSLEDNLWDVVIFTLGGCPGPIVGVFMTDPSVLTYNEI